MKNICESGKCFIFYKLLYLYFFCRNKLLINCGFIEFLGFLI